MEGQSEMTSAASDHACSLFDALDLPRELHQLQNAYWDAEREWRTLDGAYQTVLKDMLARDEQINGGSSNG